MYHHGNVMLSAAKHLVLRPFASLRVTHKCANLVWFDLEKWEQGRAKPNKQAAALILLARKFPDTLKRLAQLAA
jgi:hypothetical protein